MIEVFSRNLHLPHLQALAIFELSPERRGRSH